MTWDGIKARLSSLEKFLPAILFLGLFALYNANASVIDEGDAVPSVNLSFTLLQTGRLSFDPETHPELFKWRSRAPLRAGDDFFFVGWHQVFGDRTAAEWRRSGHLEFNGPRYYLLQAPKSKAYVSTFGPIPGLLALPVMAPFYALDHAIAYKVGLKTSVAKLVSSALVASIAVLIFLIARRRTTSGRAVLLAVIYGAGTCAWAVSSQNLWQQTANQWFLAIGAFFLLGNVDVRRSAIFAGLAFGAAAACRATGVIVLGLVLLHFVVHHRKSAWSFVAGAVVVPLLVALYNQHHFGTPLAVAQELVGHEVARQKTGSPELWQTPILVGAAGLLLSPSRGLLVFSPLLAESFWGMARVFRDPSYRALRPLAAGAIVTMMAQSKWFDWWGGWTYGYRPWMDSVPYLVLCLLPLVESLTATRRRRAYVAVALGWAMFAQAVGAMTYDRSWNLRQIFVVRRPDRPEPEGFLEELKARHYAEVHGGQYLGPSLCDIDLHFCRHRLWSVEDSIILYHATHYAETRGRRLPPSWSQLGKPL